MVININFSGGNEKGKYYAGLGYNKSNGLPINSFYERYSFVFNGSYNISDWLSASSNFNYNRANWENMPASQASEGSYFGRVNYDYQGKYLFSGVFRYDGYSSLLGDNRWGFFPGI